MSTNAYRRCAKCGATPSENNLVKFHRFPQPGTSNILKATAWATYCWPDQDWSSIKSLASLALKNKVLCGRHFQDSCYTDINRTRLTKYAVPGSREYVNKSLHSLRSNISVPSIVEQDPLEIETSKTTKKALKGILKRLDKSKLKALSKTEQKLYKICKNKMQGIQKLKKKLNDKSKVDKIEKFCNDESVKRLFDLNLNHTFTLFLESQLTNCRRTKQGRQYTLDQKLLALSLYKKSPSCYRLLTNIFSLPCPPTLDKMLNKVPMKPGINQQIFAGLKSMTETFTDDDSICSLVFDEMAIRKHLHYNEQIDCVDGFQDHGTPHGRTEEVACNALVFMLCGLKKTWKQPVAFYFSSKPATADRLAVLIDEVLTECFTIGLNVVSTICDMSAVNVKALSHLGATAETPYFNHDDREIVAIADPPHLLKCLRNMFMTHDIQIPINQLDGNITKGTAKWEYIKQFYVSDNMNADFVYAPALTEIHINPNARQKLRVKLAAQVFSHTVTAGILAKIATNELPTDAHATAILLTKFDDLFDALNANSQQKRRGKKYSSNLTARSPHLEYFHKMKAFISDMEILNAKIPPKSGWIQTLNAVERLWKNLRMLGIQSLSTRRLNLDPLDNFFACVRYNCGSDYNPTLSHFVEGFKTAIITNLKNCGKNKNCEDDEAVLTNDLKIFLTTTGNDEDITQKQSDDYISEVTAVLAAELEDMSSEMQECAYICGFLIKKNKNTCTQCTPLLASDPGSEDIHYFTKKEYNRNKYSLNYANRHLVKAVEMTASSSKTFVNENLQIEKIRELGMSVVKSDCRPCFDFLKLCPKHYNYNVNHILFHVFTITLKRCIVLKNTYLSQEALRKSLKRKLSL